MNLYTIIFKDTEKYSGGTLLETKWLNIPDKEISTIFYTLPTGDVLCLTHFKRIYHFVEATKDIMGKEKGKVKIEFTHLLLEREERILHYKINQINGFILYEDITNSDMINQLNPNGWKKGLK